MSAEEVKGTVHFFRPSAAQLDFDQPLVLNTDRQQHIRTIGLKKGLWRVKLNWEAGNQQYYMQKDITIE
jgi:nitrogen fixation protein FixH